MTRSVLRLLPFSALAALLLATNGPSVGSVAGQAGENRQTRNRILEHAMEIEAGRAVRLKFERPLSSGMIYAAREAIWEMEHHDEPADTGADPASTGDPSSSPSGDAPSLRRTQGCQNVFSGHGVRNIRVNQDCSFRRQAEEAIAINPTAPHNLIVGYNDSRIGFNHGGYAWTFDRGKTWGDQVPPFWQFVLADGHTADAFSDPTATFDANGNAYIGNVLFDINSAGERTRGHEIERRHRRGVLPHAGQSAVLPDLPRLAGGLVASDNNPDVAHDKELMVADAGPAAQRRTTST